MWNDNQPVWEEAGCMGEEVSCNSMTDSDTPASSTVVGAHAPHLTQSTGGEARLARAGHGSSQALTQKCWVTGQFPAGSTRGTAAHSRVRLLDEEEERENDWTVGLWPQIGRELVLLQTIYIKTTKRNNKWALKYNV